MTFVPQPLAIAVCDLIIHEGYRAMSHRTGLTTHRLRATVRNRTNRRMTLCVFAKLLHAVAPEAALAARAKEGA